MAAFNTFDCFRYDLGCGLHSFNTDAIHIYLTNNAPSNSADNIRSELAPLANANGYNQSALSGQNWTENGVLAQLTANNDTVWTANGNFGPFRYVVLVNNNATPDDGNNASLIGWWDYTSSINCNNGESFTVDFPANKLVLQIS